MIALARDPIARVVALLWLGISALYFLPGVPVDLLQRLGDRYSTLPLWPWAIAACVYGIAGVRNSADRRFWKLQALSFTALLSIEAPWALARATDTPAWNIAAEWCYFAYYAFQLTSAAESRTARIRATALCVLAASSLSVLVLRSSAVYDTGRPSYVAYLAFDLLMTTMFWRLRARVTGARSVVYAGLAITSAIVFATDVLDWLSYEKVLGLVAGMKTDILWTLPPLCYALVARFGRQRLDSSS